MLRSLEAVCGDIGRSSLKRVAFGIAYGGNLRVASLFLQLTLEKRETYMV